MYAWLPGVILCVGMGTAVKKWIFMSSRGGYKRFRGELRMSGREMYWGAKLYLKIEQ